MNEVQVVEEKITFPKPSIVTIEVKLKLYPDEAGSTPFYAWGETKQAAQADMIRALVKMFNEERATTTRLSKELDTLRGLKESLTYTVRNAAKRLGILRK